MTIDVPPGYLTRPVASKVYNRSKRALERDLDEAYKSSDEEVLLAFKLLTKDGAIREAEHVTTELVEQLKKAGENPVWCVSEAWLLEQYGKKGAPKPRQSRESTVRIDTDPSPDQREPNHDQAEGEGAQRSTSGDSIAVLKARSTWLEEENSRLKDEMREHNESRREDRKLQEKNIELLTELLAIFKGEKHLPGGARPLITMGPSRVAEGEVIEPAAPQPQKPETRPTQTAAKKKPVRRPKEGSGDKAKPAPPRQTKPAPQTKRKRNATTVKTTPKKQGVSATRGKAMTKATAERKTTKNTSAKKTSRKAARQKRGFFSRLFSS